ncbi:MAG: CHAT domain-containing protein [Cyanobacteria bacterium P01_G01_bin.54]
MNQTTILNQYTSRTLQQLGFGAVLTLPVWLVAEMPLLAQSIIAAPDGTGTIIHHNGNTYHIKGGTQAGANLFHSFQDFGLSQGEVANFLSHPSIRNIFGRVVGGNASMIDGLIQANPNLYLMNPAGVVFGPNASLNVSGDFYATTADRISFADGWFNATGTNDYATLVGTPNQFAFLSENPSAILNQGNLQTVGNLSLMGGTVQNQGELAATHGTVTLAAVPGTRLVNLAQPGMLLSLELPATALEQGVSPLDLPALLTGPSQGNSPVVDPNPARVSTGGLPLENSDHHRASIFPANTNQGDVVIAGTVKGEQVDLYAAGKVTPTDSKLVQGKARVTRFSETGDNPDQAVFIDHRADHPEDLLYGAASGTIAQIIERDENGIEVVTEQLTEISDAVGKLESVAIVAEGNAGNFWLGNQWMTTENISDYQPQLQTWGDALTENADILLYSCFTALGATGEALIAEIANFTGADVAASVDVTGSANYGGDWQLEYSIGDIEARNPVTEATLTAWQGKLLNHTVDSLADDGSGGTTFREAIAAAGTNDEITFSVVGTVTLNGTPLSWNNTKDNLIIDGNGSTVSGNNLSRVFVITADNATLRNLTIRDGVGAGDGGGIDHNSTGTLTLENVTITNNSASVRGGGIHNLNGNVVLTHSTLDSNSSGTGGGGIFSTNGTVTLTDSTVSNNSAGVIGGGIWATYPGSPNTVTLTNSTVSGNSAGSNSGGIFVNAGVLNVIDSTISGNSANNEGGGIRVNLATLNLTHSTVSGNSTNSHGGGIHSRNGQVTLTNSTVSGNSANGNGGGIASDTAVPTRIVTLTNSTIAFNTASGNGGGLYVQNGLANPIANTIIANNIAIGTGPDIFADLSSSTVQHSLLTHTVGISGLALNHGVNGNIIGQDPRLAPLAHNGGPTQTHALLSGSPAIDAGDNRSVTVRFDQRGFARLGNGIVDIGAYEVESASTVISLTPLDYQPLTPLDALSLLEMTMVDRDRVSQLLAQNRICEAVATLDQRHTQNIEQQLGRFASQAPMTCAEMQQRLPDDAALLYVFAQTDKLHLLTLRSEDEPSHTEFPLSREILLAELSHLQQELTDPVRRLSKRFLSPAQQLYQWIVQPLLPELAERGIRNLLFSLDDGLRTLPLAALHDGEQFLIEQYQATLIPSLSLTPTQRSHLQEASVFALGIGDFEQLAPLPAVPLELASIQRQFPATVSLQNQQATLINFQNQMRRQPSQIVHLATHGNFQPGQVNQSYIQFWDGRLGLQQIEQINWYQSAVELLVLSACRTAFGDTTAEYGFAGLAVQAEAGAAMAGLWLVNDLATFALMDEFYRQLSLGQPKGEALRQAQLALMRGTVQLADQQLVGVDEAVTLPQELQGLGDRTFWHPYYWSGFTLIGNPW